MIPSLAILRLVERVLDAGALVVYLAPGKRGEVLADGLESPAVFFPFGQDGEEALDTACLILDLPLGREVGAECLLHDRSEPGQLRPERRRGPLEDHREVAPGPFRGGVHIVHAIGRPPTAGEDRTEIARLAVLLVAAIEEREHVVDRELRSSGCATVPDMVPAVRPLDRDPALRRDLARCGDTGGERKDDAIEARRHGLPFARRHLPKEVGSGRLDLVEPKVLARVDMRLDRDHIGASRLVRKLDLGEDEVAGRPEPAREVALDLTVSARGTEDPIGAPAVMRRPVAGEVLEGRRFYLRGRHGVTSPTSARPMCSQGCGSA